MNINSGCRINFHLRVDNSTCEGAVNIHEETHYEVSLDTCYDKYNTIFSRIAAFQYGGNKILKTAREALEDDKFIVVELDCTSYDQTAAHNYDRWQWSGDWTNLAESKELALYIDESDSAYSAGLYLQPDERYTNPAFDCVLPWNMDIIEGLGLYL